VLHALVDTNLVGSGRLDVCAAHEWLQICVVPLAEGAALGPHRHAAKRADAEAATPVTQEAWLVLRGGINIALFDEDRRLMFESLLSAGQLLVTFAGGHAFSGATRDTVLLECKNGPYCGKDYSHFEAEQ